MGVVIVVEKWVGQSGLVCQSLKYRRGVEEVVGVPGVSWGSADVYHRIRSSQRQIKLPGGQGQDCSIVVVFLVPLVILVLLRLQYAATSSQSVCCTAGM